ncbi:MAG: LysR family transcriptional regulator [Ahrensia sp.]|nr:LysR family transcriptional regulator [Ahrensia sp.]
MQVLVKLAELGSMRRAAAAVNMTQPAVSQMIAELERLLETTLFLRHARGVEPTPATRELLPIAQRILEALEDGAETVANRLLQQGGVVRITASPAALRGLIEGKLDTFTTVHPDVQVHISQAVGNDPLEGIVDGSADIVCTREPAVTPEGWTFVPCIEDALIVVCGAKHPLAGKKSVEAAELGACKWLINRVGSVARNRFEEISERHGWPQSARCQVIMHIPELTKEMLLTGKYLAILPRSVAVAWLQSGEVVQVYTEINVPMEKLGFLWRADSSASATLKFASYLKSIYSLSSYA